MNGTKSARFEGLRPIAGACLAVASVTAWASDLQLLRVTPAGNDVPAQSQIVFAFDRDVVPLGRMERDASDVPVTITPSPDCRWRWLDTQDLVCNSAAGGKLPAATEYSVQIGSGLTAQSTE